MRKKIVFSLGRRLLCSQDTNSIPTSPTKDIEFNKWVEAKALRTNLAIVIAKFLYKQILSRYGCLLTLISD